MVTFITSKSIGETITINVPTSTGYWKYNHDGADSSVFENGEQIITITNANGEFTLISCDSEGNVSGDIVDLGLVNNQITSFDGTGLINLTGLNLNSNLLTSFDGTDLSALTYLFIYNNQLTSFNGSGLSTLNDLTLQNNQLTSFDATGLNNLQFLNISNNLLTNPTSTNNSLLSLLAANELANDWDSGEFYTTGGRTSAGTADYDYLIANNWVVDGADLVPVVTGKLRVKGVGQINP